MQVAGIALSTTSVWPLADKLLLSVAPQVSHFLICVPLSVQVADFVVVQLPNLWPETTFICAFAVNPLVVFAVIVTVPAFLPVTVPPLTVAIEASLVDHIIVLFVEFVGKIVAVKDLVVPASIVAEPEFKLIFEGSI